MLKYLRIAVTALSLTACMLLVALWVRSYWRESVILIQFIDILSTRSAHDKWYSDYERATLESSGGCLWFDLRTRYGGRSGTPSQPGIHWWSHEYDAENAAEKEAYLTDAFLVDDPKDLPFLLRSVGFHAGRYDDEWDDGLHLIMPHWLAALACAAVAGLPWLPWRKSFSLRTLLIATALIAVGLGVIVALA
jgi:hypothetical protein